METPLSAFASSAIAFGVEAQVALENERIEHQRKIRAIEKRFKEQLAEADTPAPMRLEKLERRIGDLEFEIKCLKESHEKEVASAERRYEREYERLQKDLEQKDQACKKELDKMKLLAGFGQHLSAREIARLTCTDKWVQWLYLYRPAMASDCCD